MTVYNCMPQPWRLCKITWWKPMIRYSCTMIRSQLISILYRKYFYWKYIVRASSDKLAPRYMSPYKIIEKVSNDSYKISLPPRWKIYPVFTHQGWRSKMKLKERNILGNILISDGQEGQKDKRKVDYNVQWFGEA